MKRTTITKIDLTEAEAAWVISRGYGMYSPSGDKSVGRAIVRFVKKGIEHGGNSYAFSSALVDAVGDALSSTEASDTEVRETIAWMGDKLFAGNIPSLV